MLVDALGRFDVGPGARPGTYSARNIVAGSIPTARITGDTAASSAAARMVSDRSASIVGSDARRDIDIPCGRNEDGKYYDCFGADKPIVGELSSSDSKGEPAYRVTPGYDLATGLGSVDATSFNAWPAPVQTSK